mmetsp:Transcript_28209/g.39687  ORF Transcript_28209/g.39687 Transcript_28209/m.39687 type:complete len:509 (+) Transcript_28209:387-1913(+)
MTEKHRRGTSPAACALDTDTGDKPNPGADRKQKQAKKQSRTSSTVRKYASRRRRKQSSSFGAGDHSASGEIGVFGDFHGNDTTWMLLALTMTILLLAFSGSQASYKHQSQESKAYSSSSHSKQNTRRRTTAIHRASSEHSTISSTKTTPAESTQKTIPKTPSFTKSYYRPRPMPRSLTSTTNPNGSSTSSSSSPGGSTQKAIESNTLASNKSKQHSYVPAPGTTATATTKTIITPPTRQSSTSTSPDLWKTLKSLHEPSSDTDLAILWILNESHTGNYLRDIFRKCHTKSIMDLSIGIGNNHADINTTPSLTIAATSQLITPHTGRIFAILQDPVDTAMASINHERKVRHRELPPSIDNTNLDHLTDNPLTRHLANVGSTTHLTMEHYETAKTNMEKYVLVGIANRLETAIDRFERYFGWTFTNHPSLQERCRKVSILTSSDSTLEESESPSDELKTELRQRNNFDVLLYNYASTTLFDNQGALVKDVPINNRVSATTTTQRRLRRGA